MSRRLNKLTKRKREKYKAPSWLKEDMKKLTDSELVRNAVFHNNGYNWT